MPKLKPKKEAPRKAAKASIKAAADRAEKRSKGETPETAKVDIDPTIVKAEMIEAIVEEVKAKMGRPTKYKPEYARIAAALCRRGATDFELAEEFEVTTSTIWRWQCQHEEFHSAVREGKSAFDDRIERALAQRAAGYAYHTEKVFQFQGQIVRARTVEHVPADVGAAKLWLTNRRPSDWQEVQKVEHGAAGDFARMTDEELEEHVKAEAAAVGLLQSGGSGKGKTKH